MPERVLTGTRVRNRRLDRGLRQADVARQVGISGSYLNLIEHNRRRIGGKLLGDLARVLEIDAVLLEDEISLSVLSPLQEAAADFPQASVEDARAEDLIARFPGWAALIAAQKSRITALEAQIAALSNRLAHDTQIANSLHEVISTATAIRSTASILVDSPDLDRDWRARFHGNIDGDSARLAESSQALLALLDSDAGAGLGPDAVASPVEQAEAVVAQAGSVLADGVTSDDPHVQSILNLWTDQARSDLARLPAPEFDAAARLMAFDPARLAARFAVPLEVALRRLALIPEASDCPPMGLARCDAAGVVTYQKPVLDFRLPRAGTACPLWPLYQALTQPGRAVRRVVRMPGPARTAFECFAIAAPVGDVAFGAEPQIEATMLVRPAAANTLSQPVGPGCRLCPIEACSSRRQPSVVAAP